MLPVHLLRLQDVLQVAHQLLWTQEQEELKTKHLVVRANPVGQEQQQDTPTCPSPGSGQHWLTAVQGAWASLREDRSRRALPKSEDGLSPDSPCGTGR